MASNFLQQNVQASCVQILSSVRSSNLNFSCQETPFSIYLTIRKSPIKFHHVSEALTQGLAPVQNAVIDNLVKTTVDENTALKNVLEELETELEASKNIAKTLEAKIDSAEAKVFSQHKEVQQWREALSKKDDEIKALKNVIKNDKTEILKDRSEQSQLKKILKSKEKEIYNLENAKQNQQDTIKTLKEVTNKLKQEKTKLEKEIKIRGKKIAKSNESAENNNNYVISYTESSANSSLKTSSSFSSTASALSASISNMTDGKASFSSTSAGKPSSQTFMSPTSRSSLPFTEAITPPQKSASYPTPQTIKSSSTVHTTPGSPSTPPWSSTTIQIPTATPSQTSTPTSCLSDIFKETKEKLFKALDEKRLEED